MKIVLSVRSELAFNLLTKLIAKEKNLPDMEIQNRNADTVHDLEDAIEFFKADLYIVDRQLVDSDLLIAMLTQQGLGFLEIQGNVKDVLPVLKEQYGIEEEEEEPIDEIHYERNERQRVVVQEKVIEKEVIRTTYQAIPSKIVIVGSLYRGAGSTILSTNLARMIAERGIDVAYIEHPLIQPYMFDYLQIHQDTEKPFHDIAREIQVEGMPRSKKNSWIKQGVKWHVIDSRKDKLPSFTYENFLVLSHTVQASVLVVDISDRWLDPETQKFLTLADEIILCVEPDPIKYDRALFSSGNYRAREKKVMDFLKDEMNDAYEIVLMKNVKEIDAKAVREMLHKKPLITLPFIPYQDIQKSLFKSQLLYDAENTKGLFEKNLMPLVSRLIPKNFMEINEKKGGLLKKMVKKVKK